MRKPESLVKPDMQAVLERTRLGNTLSNFLLPVMEAVSNAMHSIEDRFGDASRSKGKIHVSFNRANDPEKLVISVTDNGVGLHKDNYQSFRTPFSGYKLKQKGRGFGRFIAFKIFSSTHYATRYLEEGHEHLRAFFFDIGKDKEIIPTNETPDFSGIGLQVTYRCPLPIWNDLIKALDATSVTDEIASHFLPFFLYKWLPEITLQFDGGEPENLTTRFRTVFVETEAGMIECDIDGETESIQYSIARVPRTKQFPHHCLLFAAADRIVGQPRDLTNTIGSPFFVNEDNEKYIIIAVARSEAFDNRLNDSRTGMTLSPKAIEQIVSQISGVIQGAETAQIQKIKQEQAVDLDEALKENPILKLGLRGRSIAEYVSSKPNNWDSERFISDLAIERFRATHDLSRAIVQAAANAEEYEKTIEGLMSQIDQSKKESLAEYIIHRRSIIALVEAARKFQADGKRSPEDSIHDLIFKRFHDSAGVDYFGHNLWLIDDALAFVPYISSDRTLHGGRRQKGDKVADLAFFEDSLVMGDDNGMAVAIVEFKKPSRDDYRVGSDKTDPVMQGISTLEQATSVGGISKTDGTFFNLSNVVRKFAFIVADHSPSLVNVLKFHDFKNDLNRNVYFRYRDNEEVYIQAMGYDTLIENAKKRNQAFFHVLLGE